MMMLLLPGQKLIWSFSSLWVSLPLTFINDFYKREFSEFLFREFSVLWTVLGPRGDAKQACLGVWFLSEPAVDLLGTWLISLSVVHYLSGLINVAESVLKSGGVILPRPVFLRMVSATCLFFFVIHINCGICLPIFTKKLANTWMGLNWRWR